MIKAVLLISMAAVALGQFNWWQNIAGNAQIVDTVHGLRVQYDDSHDIVIFVSSSDCYIVEADSDRAWDQLIHDDSSLHTFTEDVYQQIESDSGVTSLTHQQAINAYHSRLEQWECRNKDVHKVAYNTASN